MKALIVGLLALTSISAFSAASFPEVTVDRLEKVLKSEELIKCKTESRRTRLFTNSCTDFVNSADISITLIKKSLVNMSNDRDKDMLLFDLGLLKAKILVIQMEKSDSDAKINALDIEIKVKSTISSIKNYFSLR